MTDIQPYSSADYIVAAIGLVTGSALLIAIIFIMILGINKIIFRRKPNYSNMIGISTILVMALGLLFGKSSPTMFLSQLFGGFLVGFIVAKIAILHKKSI